MRSYYMLASANFSPLSTKRVLPRHDIPRQRGKLMSNLFHDFFICLFPILFRLVWLITISFAMLHLICLAFAQFVLQFTTIGQNLRSRQRFSLQWCSCVFLFYPLFCCFGRFWTGEPVFSLEMGRSFHQDGSASSRFRFHFCCCCSRILWFTHIIDGPIMWVLGRQAGSSLFSSFFLYVHVRIDIFLALEEKRAKAEGKAHWICFVKYIETSPRRKKKNKKSNHTLASERECVPCGSPCPPAYTSSFEPRAPCKML